MVRLCCGFRTFLRHQHQVRNPIGQDVRTPMQHISAWPTEIMSGMLGMKQSGYTKSARVANDAQERVCMV
jgi:hypothetical protein